MTLLELIQTFEVPQDLELYHSEVDINKATICQIQISFFTPKGLSKFSNELSSKVTQIAGLGTDYLSVTVENNDPIGLEKFTFCLAGFCSESDYNEWFNN